MFVQFYYKTPKGFRPACGSDGVMLLDRRWSRKTMIEKVKAKHEKMIKQYDAFAIFRGTFLTNKQISDIKEFDMKIKTNGQTRPLFVWDNLSENEKEIFDWAKESLFFRYKGQAFALEEFLITEIPGWHGITSLTAFSAILIKIVEDEVIVGRSFS